ncbi:TonB-dependent receptor domain-containing protein [Aquimarina spongiae]|uniref:Outer membrane receptor proteins, mostly Fe transport n=1 Tax=Aquimarina spongiae TaxID=570521 RepID=A0A1M6CLF5_9FLAO|nr:TonB-dependent receptor [Aquimarina spongiae]SHI61875.1 Outer membrane receptor proteins, mostly Fe transport [Aquimarina spongiae]
MKTKTVRLLVVLGIIINHYAIAQYNITGIIANEQSSPIESATISLINSSNNQFIRGVITSTEGIFNIPNINNGSYIIIVSNLGYAEFRTAPFTIEDVDKNLGVIQLFPEAENLEEVTITAEKPIVEVLPDKTVFNVQNTLGATGISGYELLRKAPGVIIDNNDNLVVEGKTGVLIYIDDKPSVLRGQDLVNYLKTIQSSDIEAIEIITQPSSKYDAEGNAGIINIKLKRDKTLGTNGSVGSGFTYGDFARYTSSLSFNNRSKKSNFYGSYSNRFGKSFNFINLFRTQNNTIFDARTETINDNNSNNIKLGYDYYANSKSTFGIIVSGNFSNNISDSDSRTPIILQGTTTPDQVLVAGSDTDTQTQNLYANINYKFKDTLGHSLNVDLDYGGYNSDRTNLQPNRYFNGDETELISETINFMVTPIEITLLTAKADYEQNLWKGKLGLGVKYSNINTENEFDFFDRINGNDLLNLDRTNDFTYDERISAAYVNYNRKFKKTSLQFGLRVEHTDSDGQLFSAQQNADDRVKRNYTDFFPSGGITHQVNRKNSLALLYSRRIQRPNYQNLNPFEYKIDELSFRQGNPFLQPQYTDNIKLSHTYNYRLTTAISYSFIKDYFAQVTEALGDDQNFIITRNVANQKIINLSISYPTKITNWWSVYYSINAYRSIFEATDEDFLSVSQNTLSFYGQNTFSLPKEFKMEISGWYSSPSIWGGTYQTQSLGSLNLALQKKFLDNKLTARLAFNDILFTTPWKGDTQFGDLRIDGSGGSDSRQVQFNLTYNFGRKEIKASRKRKTGLEDEKKRI